MNDFFNVLDDFELEDFVLADDSSSTSSSIVSMDVASDATPDPGPAEIDPEDAEYSDELVDNVKGDKAEVTENGQYVWRNGTNPFANTTGKGVYFAGTGIEKTDGGGEGDNFTYTEIGISDIKGISLTQKILSTAKAIFERGTGSGFQFSGSAGLSLKLNNGYVQGGSFASGNAQFSLGSYTGNAATYTNGNDIVVTIQGFEDPADDTDLIEWTGDETSFDGITTTQDEGASVTVTNDYNFEIDGHEVKIKNVAAGSVVFTYNEDGGIDLDLSGLTAAANEVINVVSAADADNLIPPTDPDDGVGVKANAEIKIGNSTFTYTNHGDAHFTLNDNGSVEGFVLATVNDAITVTKSQNIAVYDEEDTDNAIIDVNSGNNYTITKLANNYRLTITESADVVIGDTEMNFNISKATKAALATTPITVIFDEDGTIESVDGLYRLTSTSDALTVTGADVTSEEDGLPVRTSGGVLNYISVSNGDFTLTGGVAGEQQIAVASGKTVYGVYDNARLVTTEGAGTIVDGVNNITYTHDGGYFNADEADGILNFVFTNAGDSVTLPKNGEGIDLFYLDETTAHKLPLPAIAQQDGFKVTLTDVSTPTDPQFTISNIEEGATIPAIEPLRNPIIADADDTITFNLEGNVTGLGGLEGSVVLRDMEGAYTIDINGDTLTYNTSGDITVTGDTSTGLAQVSGLVDGDAVSSSDDNTVFVFATDGDDTFTVNDKVYTITGDTNGVSITAGGVVTGLDEDAHLQVSAGPVTVNGVTYSADDVATANLTGESIISYKTKAGDDSSFIEDYNYPLFHSSTKADEIMYANNWLNLDYVNGKEFTTENTFYESTVTNVSELNRASDTTPALVVFDTKGTVSGALSTTAGKSVAWITDTAEGEKNIVLGNHGDAVIMQGDDEYGSVHITVGGGHDTIFVGGYPGTDKVVHQANMKTYIDMGGASDGSVDKIHTYAAANANIVLENYDETAISGVVLHDPEIPYADNIVDAIQDNLLVFEDGGITAIDRDEFDKNQSLKEGTDRKTRITVDNINDAHQNMIRLFGYKDSKDTYGDDYGQLVGFTDNAGGVLDASDLAEDLILVGNKDGNKAAGSYLKTGAGDDTVFAGAQDTIDTGDGVDLIIMDDDTGREGATIVVGAGAGDAVMNLQSGFNGDVFDVTSYDGKLDYTFEDGVLAIIDKSSKSSLVADTTVTGDFVEQTFINGSDTLYAAVAKEEGIISVTDDNDIVPNYYLAKDGGIDFSAYSGNVGLDVDGLDGDWTGDNYVGSSNVTLGSAVSSLIGGKGDTIFKGGAADEVLIAGTGEGSLYGGGGKNLLVGNITEDKFGSTEFFNIGIHNGAQNTITGFEFIADGGTNQATFDALNLGLSDNNDVTAIETNADGSVSVAIKGVESGATETVTIVDAAGKEFLIDRGTQTETVAQIAATEVTVNNSYVDFYCATDDANGATVKVGNIASTEIWLDAPDYGNGVDYSNSRFTVVDARGSNAEVLIAGNDIANTIYGGAGNASMWGGSGIVNDVMYGGTGHNEFYFEAYNGNDTIMSANDGDVIQLGVTLDQINFDGTNITATGIDIKLNDGSSLTVNSTAEVNIVLDDGTTAKVNRQTGQFE
ncbi:MAG: hypothetical protein IJQ85_04485 [Selenomonadaceae bacterium]|nr:hypothetical protein [Selenomonadaceae bacterium]